MYSDAIGVTCLHIAYARFDAYRSPIFDEYPIRATVHDDACTMLVSILQVGLHSGLTAPITTTKITATTAPLTSNGITRVYSRMVAKSSSTIKEHLIWPVMLALLDVDAETSFHSGKTLLQLRISEISIQSRTFIPFCQHIVGRATTSHPIDSR